MEGLALRSFFPRPRSAFGGKRVLRRKVFATGVIGKIGQVRDGVRSLAPKGREMLGNGCTKLKTKGVILAHTLRPRHFKQQ